MILIRYITLRNNNYYCYTQSFILLSYSTIRVLTNVVPLYRLIAHTYVYMHASRIAFSGMSTTSVRFCCSNPIPAPFTRVIDSR